ncbi:MAG TPA: hypothetical protein VN631_17750, partial [Negativicutes bacterium]|nr:hypothetical protein [Negativicutes bacterium]
LFAFMAKNRSVFYQKSKSMDWIDSSFFNFGTVFVPRDDGCRPTTTDNYYTTGGSAAGNTGARD